MWRKGTGKCLYNFCIKRGNDSGEILTAFLNTAPIKKSNILKNRRSKWTYAELHERVKVIDERLFAYKDASIWNRIAFGTTRTKVYRKLINQGTERDLNKQQTWLRTHKMSRVQLRNKWWHRTTYSATNKTLFALASAERNSYQSSHSSRNSWDRSPKTWLLFLGAHMEHPVSLAFKNQNIRHISQSQVKP